MMEPAVIVRIVGEEGRASIARIARGAGPLAGTIGEFGPAIVGEVHAGYQTLAFNPPHNPESQEWLRRCRGEVSPGVWFWVGHVERDDFNWSGPGGEAAQVSGLQLASASLPEAPKAWLALFAGRPDLRPIA